MWSFASHRSKSLSRSLSENCHFESKARNLNTTSSCFNRFLITPRRDSKWQRGHFRPASWDRHWRIRNNRENTYSYIGMDNKFLGEGIMQHQTSDFKCFSSFFQIYPHLRQRSSNCNGMHFRNPRFLQCLAAFSQSRTSGENIIDQ